VSRPGDRTSPEEILTQGERRATANGWRWACVLLRKWPVFRPPLDRQSLLWAHSARSLTHSLRWRSSMHS